MKTAALLSAIMVTASSATPSQHASAKWKTNTDSVSAGKSIRTIIEMNIDDGWHTYWKNPGEAGLALSIEAQLPDGWSIGEIHFPTPIRFMTGELSGFGYEGKVAFPVTVTPPAKFEGKIPPLTATSKWLTCNDETCLPGEAEMALSFSASTELVDAAYESLPRSIPGAELAILSADGYFHLTLTLPADSKLDPSGFDVFPATPDVIDPTAKLQFKKNPTMAQSWTVAAPKNEYLETEPKVIALVLKTKNGVSYEISSK